MRRLGREWLEALRSLRRAPAHAATTTALLAIGVASTTAILAVGEGLLRRPLPVRDDARLIVPYATRGDDKRLSASAIDAGAWREAPSLEGFAVARPGAVTLDRAGAPERLRGRRSRRSTSPCSASRPRWAAASTRRRRDARRGWCC